MKAIKRIICIVMIAALTVSVIMAGTISSSATGSGVGLAEWAMRAYNEGWSYVWGGDSVGAVDCSGMITSYCGGNRTSMLADAQEHGRAWGYVSDGIPNIHGLGLSRPNHVGVYVGNGMEVDARGSDYGVCYQAVGDRWNCWFKLTAVTYPTTGWEKFNGNNYYYENGEYLANTTRTIDGVTYRFASSGIATADSSAVSSSTSSASATTPTAPAPTTPVVDNGPLKKGSQGERVEKLQARLQELGYYDGAIDGDFGTMTEKAFKLFQKQAGLYEDGIAGSDADVLYSDDAPSYVPEQTTAHSKETAATGSAPVPPVSEILNPVQINTDNSDDDNSGSGETAEDEYFAAVSDDEQPAYQEAEAVEAEAAQSFASGDSGEAVIAIQSRLIKLGYLEGDADGSFGAITENAVKLFQSANKLTETGVVDQTTYDALFSNAAVKNTAVTTTGEAPAQPPVIVAATTAEDTAVERSSALLSQKSVAAISENVSARSASTANLEFIVWLAIMIVVMLIAFTIVYLAEKKRSRAMAHAGRRFQ